MNYLKLLKRMVFIFLKPSQMCIFQIIKLLRKIYQIVEILRWYNATSRNIHQNIKDIKIIFKRMPLIQTLMVDASVHAVKEHGEENRNGGNGEVAVHRLNDAVEGCEERSCSKGVREHINALRLHRLKAALTDGSKTLAARRIGFCHKSLLPVWKKMRQEK